MNDNNKLILTDCDGVLLNWEYAFHVWMNSFKGFKKFTGDTGLEYDLSKVYDISRKDITPLIREFNNSAAIGFLPSLRDSIYYVTKLHREHGYVFHVITSLSKDENAGRLRIMNLEKIFGGGVFIEYTFLDTGEDKHVPLEKYRNTGLYFIEDKVENAQLGIDYGLKSLLVEHGHNMHIKDIPNFPTWKTLYQHIKENEYA